MVAIGWILAALGGVAAIVIMILLRPLIATVFDWFAFLFRALQMAPSWFRTAVWLFISGFFMQLFVAFFIAGNVVCLQPNGQPLQMTDGAYGFIQAGVAKLIPMQVIADESTVGMLSRGKWWSWFIEEDNSRQGSASYGTLVTYATDPEVVPKPSLPVGISNNTGIFFVPQGVDSINELLGVPEGSDLPVSQTVTLYVCGQVADGKFNGACAFSSNPCTAYTTLQTIGTIQYNVQQGLATQAVGMKQGYVLTVSGGDEGGGLKYSYWGRTKDTRDGTHFWNNVGSFILNWLPFTNAPTNATMNLNMACYSNWNGWASYCSDTTPNGTNPQYFIKLPNGDEGCIQGRYQTFDQFTIIDKSAWAAGINPREDFVSQYSVSGEPAAPLPGVTYVCDKNGNTDARLFGLDIGNVTLFYIIFSVVGLVLLQRFMRNY